LCSDAVRSLAERNLARTLAVGARYRRGRGRGGFVRADGLPVGRRHSGLRVQATWRAHGYVDLLEAVAGERGGLELASLRNRQKIRGFQAGAADESTIDIGDRHQFRRVRGFHRAAVENPDPATFRLKSAGENT